MKKHLYSVICLLICFLLLFESIDVQAVNYSLKLATEETQLSSSMPTVVSLGDSYSSGEGIQPYYDQNENNIYKYTSEDWIAHRSTLAWPGLLEINGIKLNSVKATNRVVSDKNLHASIGVPNGTWFFSAVSGAVCNNIFSEDANDRQEIEVKQGHHASEAEVYNHTYKLNFQLDAITSLSDPSSVDYVTLTLGGNDLGFTEIMQDAVVYNKYINMSGAGIKKRIKKELDNFWETEDGSISLSEKLKAVYKKILESAPSATLIVAGYPQLIHLNSDGSTNSYMISYEEGLIINSGIKIFNDYLDIIINIHMMGLNIEYADVQEAFIGHGAYSEEEYINRLILGNEENISSTNLINTASFHPNEKGAQAYADSVQKVLDTLIKNQEAASGNETYDPIDNEQIPSSAVEFNGHYYYLYTGGIASTYEEALQFCADKGGYLATLTSQKENDFVHSYITRQNCGSAYFGFSDSESDGTWKWCTGEPVSYTNWHSGEPNGNNSNEDYGMLYEAYSDGSWNDGDFGNNTVNGGTAFICEWGDYQYNTGSQTPGRTTSDERDIVLVLDRSGSMEGTPIQETIKASTDFVDTILEEDASIGVVTYDSSAERNADFSMDKNFLTQTVSEISSGGGTNMESGLQEAQQMLANSNAKKKIIVLMSDGMPNDGKQGEELIAYADEIKDSGTLIYTLGFFENMGSDKSSAQYLMEELASDGCHYEVASADDLVFFFGDIADQINGQKYIYVRIACPVDVSVTYEGETLNSSDEDLNVRTDFGTLTFEESESEQSESEEKDDRIKVLRLKEGADYDLEIVGTGYGTMNYTIGFMDDDGNYDDFRRFENIRITKRTKIDTVAEVSSESILNIDDDGDGKYDTRLRAEENGYGEEVKTPEWVIFALGGAGILIFIDISIFIVLRIRKRAKRGRE